MKRNVFAAAAVAIALSSTPALAIVANYTEGATSLKANQDGFDFEIRDEVSAPGGSVRVYFSPSSINGNINCVAMGDYPIKGIANIASSVTGLSDFTSPIDGTHVAITTQPGVHDNPTCSTDKWGYFSVDSMVQGTAQYKVLGTLHNYIVEVTFGPDPANPSKNVVLRLRTNSA
ncbi:hypothetical protein [Novosphingobium sp. PASSN1]|uniref:hypothetical protein n=1 Tax=Novosphingobium sp. PASSN1 TaxID=2015561 RepID=UPI000BD1FB19|nr:hypothetical protein [Novosphingobium sp. PASSN1]OYU33879.1 MAG: hypothetical protein CFE35_17860 [Novosphingobium sp. PASSN1]